MLSKIEVRFQSAEGRRRRQAAFARTAPIRRVLFDATTLYGDGIRYHSVHVFCILIKKSIFFFGSRLFRTFFTHSGMIFATLFVVCYFFYLPATGFFTINWYHGFCSQHAPGLPSSHHRHYSALWLA